MRPSAKKTGGRLRPGENGPRADLPAGTERASCCHARQPIPCLRVSTCQIMPICVCGSFCRRDPRSAGRKAHRATSRCVIRRAPWWAVAARYWALAAAPRSIGMASSLVSACAPRLLRCTVHYLSLPVYFGSPHHYIENHRQITALHRLDAGTNEPVVSTAYAVDVGSRTTLATVNSLVTRSLSRCEAHMELKASSAACSSPAHPSTPALTKVQTRAHELARLRQQGHPCRLHPQP